MKLSTKATGYILVKATTNSEWDYCEYAIVHLSKEWKTEQTKRLALVTPLKGVYHFSSMNFYDTAVDFYRTGENEQPDIESILGDKEWVFVELDEEEQETFTVPENSLDCHRLVLSANDTAYYSAYGKHTSEEFWTERFLLTQLIEQL